MAKQSVQPVINTKLFSVGVIFQTNGVFRRRWVNHVLFWVLYYLWVAFMFGSIYQIAKPAFYVQLLTFFPLQMTLVYFNFYVLMPRLLFRRKFFLYGLALFFSIWACAILHVFFLHFYGSRGVTYFVGEGAFTYANFLGQFASAFYVTGFTAAIKLASNWVRSLQRMKDMEKQYLETELNFLKSQIQPHFFFNTLNNLYSLTLKKSDMAPEVVLKLSDLMSYILYETNTRKVPLAKEITYLQNYLDVESLRFGERIHITFDIEGQIEMVNVPPMVLILFIENSFKHGVKNNLNKINIDILLVVEEGYLYFQVKNPVTEQDKAIENVGIGLKNVRRRLDLLYGKDYSLDTEIKDNVYSVALKMPVW